MVHILHTIVTDALRDLFKKEWDSQYPARLWDDNDPNCLQHFLSEEKNGPNWKRNKLELRMLKSSNRNEWNIGELFQILLYSHSVSLLSRKPDIRDNIQILKNIRNRCAHTWDLDEIDFVKDYNKIEAIMNDLNYPVAVNDMKAVMDDRNRPTKAEIIVTKKVLEEIERAPKTKYISPILLFTNVLLFIILLYMYATQRKIDSLVSNKFYFPNRLEAHFRGRDSITSDISNLLRNGSAHAINLWGPPAFGKSTTSIAVGRRLQDHSRFNVAFVDFHEINYPEQIYSEILSSLYVDDQIEKPSEFSRLLYKVIKQRTLIIMDGVEQALLIKHIEETFRDILQRLISIEEVSVLCTSRMKFEMTSMVNIRLNNLTLSDSTEILQILAPEAPSHHAKQIAASSYGVPLLLELIGSHLVAKVWSTEELIEKIDAFNILLAVEDIGTISRNPYIMIKSLFVVIPQKLQELFLSLLLFPRPFSHDATLYKVSPYVERIDLLRLTQFSLLEKSTSISGTELFAIHPFLHEFGILYLEREWKGNGIYDEKVKKAGNCLKDFASNFDVFLDHEIKLRSQLSLTSKAVDKETVLLHKKSIKSLIDRFNSMTPKQIGENYLSNIIFVLDVFFRNDAPLDQVLFKFQEDWKALNLVSDFQNMPNIYEKNVFHHQFYTNSSVFSGENVGLVVVFLAEHGDNIYTNLMKIIENICPIFNKILIEEDHLKIKRLSWQDTLQNGRLDVRKLSPWIAQSIHAMYNGELTLEDFVELFVQIGKDLKV